jgi:uncharacterized protein YjbJ (UPF0337 family)
LTHIRRGFVADDGDKRAHGIRLAPISTDGRTPRSQGGEEIMDDKIEGKWDQGKGKVKEEAGKLGGDKSTELGGKVDQGKGKLKEGLGDVKEGLHDERVER